MRFILINTYFHFFSANFLNAFSDVLTVDTSEEAKYCTFEEAIYCETCRVSKYKKKFTKQISSNLIVKMDFHQLKTNLTN